MTTPPDGTPPSDAYRGTHSQAALRADDGSRTRDLELGTLALYQLSYVRAGLILWPESGPSLAFRT